MSGIVRYRVKPDPPRIVVEHADEYVDVSAELLDDWRSDEPNPHVTRLLIDDREVFSFGTPGEGVGVASYEVVREPDERDRVTEFGGAPADWRRVLLDTALLRRVR